MFAGFFNNMALFRSVNAEVIGLCKSAVADRRLRYRFPFTIRFNGERC